MSKYSNPAGRASGASAQYIRDLLELLGERDPLDIQRTLGVEVRKLIAGLTPAQLRTPEAPGKWSMLGVLEHLVDQELVTGYRYRSVIAEDEPPLRGYDQDRWAQRLHYGDADAATLVTELEVLRGRNLRLLQALGKEEKERFGHHAERGPESVSRLIMLMASHDMVHRQQLTRIRTAVTGAKAP